MRARPSLTAAVLACLLAGTAPAALAGSPDEPRAREAGAAARADGTAPDAPRWARQGTRPGQTSDGVTGTFLTPATSFQRGQPLRTTIGRRTVVPGVTLTQWDERDARGPVRLHLLTVDTRRPEITLDYGATGKVRRTATVRTILARDDAVAGVNGDFFDIGDTGAPLGVGRDRVRGVLHGPREGWNSAFFVTRTGEPDIGTLPMRAMVRERPDLTITNVNSPSVRPGGVGLYTRDWGWASGYRVTDGQRRDIRVVHIRDGRVHDTSRRLPDDQPIRGQLLVGRGAGARALAPLKVGRPATLAWWLEGGPRMAISGNRFLVLDGVIKAVDDQEMHPRTAVGIDRDTGEVLLLAVDGRQTFSRGYTMVELADTMVDLGADEALNLDGGGSTTLVATDESGVRRVVNSPSDGQERLVANALEVLVRPGS